VQDDDYNAIHSWPPGFIILVFLIHEESDWASGALHCIVEPHCEFEFENCVWTPEATTGSNDEFVYNDEHSDEYSDEYSDDQVERCSRVQ
jgi:hypothetical protein